MKQQNVILQLIESGGPGGAETIVLEVCKSLAERSYYPIVGLLHDGWLNQQLLRHGIETIIIENKYPYDPVCFRRLIKTIYERNVSVIHSHEFMMNVYGALAARVTRRPIIATIHGKNYYWEKRRRRTALRVMSYFATRTIAVSEDLKGFIVKRVGINANRISVIHNGIDISRYNLPKQENKLNITSPIIGTVGNLYPVKGHIYLLKAAKKIINEFPAATFIFIGKKTEYINELIKESDRLGLEKNVKFLGFREDVPELLSIMDVFAAPSLSEGISLAILQAMAAAKPVVATGIGGTPEIITHGKTGILVPSKDSDMLANNILLLLKNKDLANKLAYSAKEKVRDKFSIDYMVNNYINAYGFF